MEEVNESTIFQESWINLGMDGVGEREEKEACMSEIDLSGQALYLYISNPFQLNKSHFEGMHFIDPNRALGA